MNLGGGILKAGHGDEKGVGLGHEGGRSAPIGANCRHLHRHG